MAEYWGEVMYIVFQLGGMVALGGRRVWFMALPWLLICLNFAVPRSKFSQCVSSAVWCMVKGTSLLALAFVDLPPANAYHITMTWLKMSETWNAIQVHIRGASE